jgi:hypothetical protein
VEEKGWGIVECNLLVAEGHYKEGTARELPCPYPPLAPHVDETGCSCGQAQADAVELKVPVIDEYEAWLKEDEAKRSNET